MRSGKVTVRESLRVSFKDGVFASIMSGVTDQYFIPFAIALGATAQQVGWVSGFPNFFGSLSQLFAVQAVHRIGGRLKLIVATVLTQATLLLGIALLAWFDFPHPVPLFLALLILFVLNGALAGTAWGSLMTDYIPNRKRGRYFGWRNKVCGMVHVASMIAAGLLLYRTEGFSPVAGFLIIFAVGAAARFVSAGYIANMRDVPQKRDPASDFTFFMFLARFRESNFVKFVAFVAMLTFSAYLSAPFFAVFMLRDLQLGYLSYMVLQVISAVAGLVALPLWGAHADAVGNVRVLRLSGFLACLIPLFWLVSQNVYYLGCVQMLGGFAWSGLTLCATNFIYDAVTPQKRVRCISYFQVMNGTAIFLGASLGGFLATKLPPLQGYPLLTLFLLSALCRLFFYFLLFNRFREVRPSREVSLQELFFSVVGIRPLIGISRD
ncbi:MAG TPA: MFS transporter [Candidatus Binatia bacterium]